MIYQEGNLWFASVKDKETDITLHTRKEGRYSLDNLMREISILIKQHKGQ